MSIQPTDPRICPVFRYKNAAAAIDWLTRAFQFSTHEVHTSPEGAIVHAELRLGASAIGISSAGPANADNPWSQVRLGIYVCVKEVDALFTLAHHAGASVAQPLTDTSYGAREGSLRDLGGHLWSLGNYAMADPSGPPTIYTGLHYEHGAAAATFLHTGLGFRPGVMVEVDDVIDDGAFALGRDVVMISAPEKADAHWGGQTQRTGVCVTDVDAAYARALTAGAIVLQPPQNTTSGVRVGYVQDAEGFAWGVSDYRPQGGRFKAWPASGSRQRQRAADRPDSRAL